MHRIVQILFLIVLHSACQAQTVKSNIAYVENGHERQVLDIYAPADAKNLGHRGGIGSADARHRLHADGRVPVINPELAT